MSSDLLVMVYDLNPLPWSSPHTPYTLTAVTQQLTVFINTFYLLNKLNQFVLILCNNYTVQYVYPLPTTTSNKNSNGAQHMYDDDSKQPDTAQQSDNAAESTDLQYMNIHHIVNKQIKQFVERQHNQKHTPSNTTLLSGALSLAMCYIHKRKLVNAKLKARIMCVMSSSDSSGQYVPVMNTVFEAQKLNVYIDTLVLTHNTVAAGSDTKPINLTTDSSVFDSNDSRLMQQASHLTNGVYYRPNINKAADVQSLLQYLLTMYLPDAVTRGQLVLPVLSSVDYRASCFCHSKPIELAFVCPVCLAIWCKQRTDCEVCKTKFPLITRQINRVS